MKVLVACEFSGTIREAFSKMGHDATSCDFVDSEIPGSHYRGDVRDLFGNNWDLMIANPPCNHLAISGAKWFQEKKEKQKAALDFVRELMYCGIPRIAIENPISIISTRIRKPSQIVHPWMFGHGVAKSTCLWLKNLPKLVPTNVVEGRAQSILMAPDVKDKWKFRSRTFSGVAEAMAGQWGTETTIQPTLLDHCAAGGT